MSRLYSSLVWIKASRRNATYFALEHVPYLVYDFIVAISCFIVEPYVAYFRESLGLGIQQMRLNEKCGISTVTSDCWQCTVLLYIFLFIWSVAYFHYTCNVNWSVLYLNIIMIINILLFSRTKSISCCLKLI